MQEIEETWVRSLGQEDPLEEEMATHSVSLPGKFHGQRSLVGYSPWDHKELDTTEQLNNKQVALVVKNPSVNAGDIRVVGPIHGSGRSPGGGNGNPLCILAWRIPWTEEPCGLQSMG